ncbi:unnamed protein product, partial [Allacma fusca]
AEVVICGSGIVGNSVAYNLIQKGITDVVIIQLQRNDSNFIGSLYAEIGSSISRLRSFQQEHVILSSLSLYKSLQEQGFDVGLCLNGGLYVAQNRESMTTICRRKDLLTHTGSLQVEILRPQEIRERFPQVTAEDLVGGALVHDDAVANPAAISKALLSLATQGGAQVVSDCDFKKVLVDRGRVKGVKTDKGVINCKYFVNSAGWYAWEFGQRQNPAVRIPVHTVGRHYLKTNPVEDALPKDFPTIIDYDSYVYINKLQDNSLVIGGFAKNAKPVFIDKVPDDPTELTFDWDHFAPTLDGAIRRLPVLKSCQTNLYTSQADSFSADGRWIIGETPEIQNYYVAAATNGNALEVGGGMGAFLAHWIAKGRRNAPLLNFDVLRFVDTHNCKKFLHDRSSEAVSKQFEAEIPYVTFFSKARNIRCSPLNATLNECGAVNGELMGYEVPLYFDPETPNSQGNILPQSTHFKPDYFEFVKKEHNACVKGVGVLDQSSYGKFLVSSAGHQVVDYLQRLCSSNVDIPIGHICGTGMLNPNGGYETDCVIVRTGKYRYKVLTPSRLQTKTPTWMKKFLPADDSVLFHDITSMYSVIQLIGPKSPSILSKVAQRDMKMRPMRSQVVDLSYAPYIQEIMRAGKDYGAKNAGWYAHRTLRMEQYLSFWGDEINTFVSPVEIDRVGKIDLTKDFMGKEAIQKQVKDGVKKRLACFMLKTTETGYSMEHDCWPIGGEPIFRNGKYIGYVTSGMYGFTNNAMMLHAFVTNPGNDSEESGIVTNEYIRDNDAIYHVDLAGKRFKIEHSSRVKIGAKKKLKTTT